MTVATISSGKIVGTTKLGPLTANVLAGSAFGFVVQVFLRQRDVLLTLAVLAVVAAAAAVPLARRWKRPLALVLAGLWGLAVIPAFTLVPDLGYGEYDRRSG